VILHVFNFKFAFLFSFSQPYAVWVHGFRPPIFLLGRITRISSCPWRQQCEPWRQPATLSGLRLFMSRSSLYRSVVAGFSPQGSIFVTSSRVHNSILCDLHNKNIANTCDAPQMILRRTIQRSCGTLTRGDFLFSLQRPRTSHELIPTEMFWRLFTLRASHVPIPAKAEAFKSRGSLERTGRNHV